jgi:hypothetical protein
MGVCSKLQALKRAKSTSTVVQGRFEAGGLVSPASLKKPFNGLLNAK